jgi:hypothetical protein
MLFFTFQIVYRMKLKTSIIFLSLVFIINLAYSQHYYPGRIILIDGEKLEGLVNLPFYRMNKCMFYKSNENAAERKIKTDSVKFVSMVSDEGKTSTLANVELSRKEKGLVFLLIEGYTTLYFTGDGINVDKHGNIVPTASAVAGRSLPEFYYMAQRKAERYPVTLAITSPAKTVFGQARAFRKLAAEYFKDWPELVKRIKNEEFTEKDVERVVTIYNEHMESK